MIEIFVNLSVLVANQINATKTQRHKVTLKLVDTPPPHNTPVKIKAVV